MFDELINLLRTSEASAQHETLRRLVTEENVTSKATLSTRKKTFRHLSELYGLSPQLVLFRALRDLWDADEAERPLLALLCASARQPLLRATAASVLPVPQGCPVVPGELAQAVDQSFPGRFNEAVQRRIGRNAIASWAQSGHLRGKLRKTRSRPASGPASTAYALLLGYLQGTRGVLLFETYWASLLDAAPGTLDAQAFAAARRGWLEYRRIGEVADITFSFLLRPPHGQH